jgi:cobaltochelatase CobN
MKTLTIGEDVLAAHDDLPVPPSAAHPNHGVYGFAGKKLYASLASYLADYRHKQYKNYAGILMHRNNWLKDDMAPFEVLAKKLEQKETGVIPVFTDGNELAFRDLVERYFSIDGKPVIALLANNVMFHIKPVEGRTIAEESTLEFDRLGIPVIFPLISLSITEEQWRERTMPVSVDMPFQLISPEMAGMTEPVFIGAQNRETKKAAAIEERCEYLAGRIANWIKLGSRKNREKKIAFMLHNCVCSGVEATIGKSFGLDAFESLARIFESLETNGYDLGSFPRTGKELRELFMSKKAFSDFRWTSVADIIESGGVLEKIPVKGVYDLWYDELPETARRGMEETWGPPPGEGMVEGDALIITGVRFGNAVAMVQPKRGCYGAKCTGEVCKILHDPACPPPHQYLAAYRYLERIFRADAIVDVGVDGSVEYLPGKANGLSESCWPQLVLGALPSVYIYNAGVTNEALVAKRRMNSVIIDHLPTPSVGVDHDMKTLAAKIGDYFEAEQLENELGGAIRKTIDDLIERSPAAARILRNAVDYKTGLAETLDAINTAREAGKISKNHVFAEIPGEKQIEDYIEECGGGNAPDGSLREELTEKLLQTGNEMAMLLRSLEGRYVPAGESGMPDENGRNILPTGRNMFGMNIDKIPTREAWERGKILAAELLEDYRQAEGRLPEKIAINMISLDITRSRGEQLSQFLFFLGVSPVWDDRERVTGLEIISLADLGRPRIDATVRITGVYRDTYPSAVVMMDDAVLMAAGLDEKDEDNYILKHLRSYQEEGEEGEDRRGGNIRIFGDPPGTYGAGLDLALLASAWKDEKDLIKYFVHASSHAYGRNLDGQRRVGAFVANAREIDASADNTASRRASGLDCNFSAQVQGGYRLIAKHLGGKSIRQYQSVSEPGKSIVTESLAENLNRAAEETIFNPFWLENIKSRDYDGASEIMNVAQNIFSMQCLAECFSDQLLDKLTDQIVNDEESRAWFAENNPHALEEIARRMLELNERGKWKPDGKTLRDLQSNYLLIEGDMEARVGNGEGIQAGSVDIITDADIDSWKEKISDVIAHISGNQL